MPDREAGAQTKLCASWIAVPSGHKREYASGPARDVARSSVIRSRVAPACGGGYAPCRSETTVGCGSSRALAQASRRAHNRSPAVGAGGLVVVVMGIEGETPRCEDC